DWVRANDECRRHILERLYDENPLTANAFPDLTIVPWRSSGWNNDRNVIRLLDMMAARGEVAVVGRRGRDRLWDLAERVYPDDPVVPAEEAALERDRRRLRALGIARSRATAIPTDANDVGAAGEQAVIEGVRGKWRVDPAYLDGGFQGRTALLSPLDRLVFDRKRMAEIFEFDYQLEMYKPVEKRRWGYWALPILHGDRLIGKVDATADRAAGVLRINAVHEDEPFGKDTAAAVDAEIEDLADWLGLDLSR
ncbi:crosslink repair DNA glycosylase YcaQ family protein, partial [Actinoplanes sp. NPDC051633]|uniref:DNA glycosylase AlkZ-like family protein n=1 Tax=Actinoplanes sp. NPDC051633 TaxID=3155670 RepID=UPI0034324DBA